MGEVIHIRFHGRGGEGVKLASRIVSRAAFLAGFEVQDSPLYGAERRGAPVVAFTRISGAAIHERGYISQPDVVVVMDESLLDHPEAAVLDGVTASAAVLINSPRSSVVMRQRHRIEATVQTQDVSGLALHLLGDHLLSAPMAGLVLKAIGLADWEIVASAVRAELADAGVNEKRIAENLVATQHAYASTAAVGWQAAVAPSTALPQAPFVIPHLSACQAAPSIVAAGNSLQRSTAGWRVFRPVIDRDHCTRCFLCFALCPDGAIHLDADHFPVIDYDHCKGCLVCVAECPPQVIHKVQEEPA